MATGIPHGWMGSEGLLAAILAATGGYRWLLVTMDGWACYREYMWLLAAILAATGGYWRLYVATGIPHGWMGFKDYLAAILAAIGGYWHPTWMDRV